MKKIFYSLLLINLVSISSWASDINEWLILFEAYNIRYPEYGEDYNILNYASHSYMEEYFYESHIPKILKQVQQENEVITVDCKLFAQIADNLKWGADNGYHMFSLNFNPELPLQGRFLYLSLNPYKFKKIFEELQNLSSANKGIWLIPVADNEYLGLSNEGPQILSKGVWIQMLIDGLERDNNDLSDKDIIFNKDNWDFYY